MSTPLPPPTFEEPLRAVESLAAKFHEVYQVEAKRQGDVRHKDAYADLPGNIKEFDRVLARYVLSNFAALPPTASFRTRELPNVDELAQMIRICDGDHSASAGQLSERLLPMLEQWPAPGAEKLAGEQK